MEKSKPLVNGGYPLHTFQDVEDIYMLYISSPEDRRRIQDAYAFIMQMHDGQFRKSGEPYYHHLIEVAYILASLHCGPNTIVAGLLHDVVEDTDVSIKEIQKRWGEEVKRTCIFEYVYFARPDSVIDGIPVQTARLKMGAQLAKESPVDADVVIGVPDSGLGAAMGYAQASGVPYSMGIVKNKYIGRTFIAPTQKERENMVFVKLNAVSSDLSGKKVIVIDDSIVRGTTSRRLVQILRRAGAKEVHFRVSSPPVKFPCHLGIDTPTTQGLSQRTSPSFSSHAFHSAKSATESLAYSSLRTRSPMRWFSKSSFTSWP